MEGTMLAMPDARFIISYLVKRMDLSAAVILQCVLFILLSNAILYVGLTTWIDTLPDPADHSPQHITQR
jgi:hypothetical protein